jgi:hypothetical protein
MKLNSDKSEQRYQPVLQSESDHPSSQKLQREPVQCERQSQVPGVLHVPWSHPEVQIGVLQSLACQPAAQMLQLAPAQLPLQEHFSGAVHMPFPQEMFRHTAIITKKRGKKGKHDF